MKYYFNNLDHTTFQRLINAVLVAIFGEAIRLTPLAGSDGGRDGETAPGHFLFDFDPTLQHPTSTHFPPPERGRYQFQVKHHRTMNTRLSDARGSVVSDFEEELKTNVLSRSGNEGTSFTTGLLVYPRSMARRCKKISLPSSVIGRRHEELIEAEQVIYFQCLSAR